MRDAVHECEGGLRQDLLFGFAAAVRVNGPDAVRRFTRYVLKDTRMWMETEGEHSEHLL
jgi:hypothetical protein